jgi:hypothetical protein
MDLSGTAFSPKTKTERLLVALDVAAVYSMMLSNAVVNSTLRQHCVETVVLVANTAARDIVCELKSSV